MTTETMDAKYLRDAKKRHNAVMPTTGPLVAKHATTKLAQTATGRKTCQRCGRTKPLDTWPMHARFKRPLNICADCLSESRAQAGRKNSATRKAKREQAAVAAAPPVVSTPVSVAAPPASSVQLLLAKLEGYAMGKDDPALTTLIEELQQAVSS